MINEYTYIHTHIRCTKLIGNEQIIHKYVRQPVAICSVLLDTIYMLMHCEDL